MAINLIYQAKASVMIIIITVNRHDNKVININV